MRVAYISSEVVPYASSGGLGDVAAALPDALCDAGVEAFRIMPLYRRVREGGHALRDTGRRIEVPRGMRTVQGEVWELEDAKTPTYLINREEYFDRTELYGLASRDYDDNLQRFAFFQKAAVQLIDVLGRPVDIVHANDWQTGLVPLYLEHGVQGLGRARREKVVFTIHNLAYQGVFDGSDFYLTNLPLSTYSIEQLEFYDRFSFLKGGIATSDLVTTVSKTYAEEIQTPEQGCGLDGLLRHVSDRLVGIVNGIDTDRWNPARDHYLQHGYTARDLAGKAKCKEELLKRTGLPRDLEKPLCGMVARLTSEKGMDLLEDAMEELLERGVSVVLLGTGQAEYHELVERWNEQWPGQFHGMLRFDHEMAHLIEAGSDIFLMASRFEPCGLNQLYSLRYGTVPIVHRTGGLADTVKEATRDGSRGTGFLFTPYSSGAFLNAVDKALEVYGNEKAWKKLVRRGMKQDFSWKTAAREYITLYEGLLDDGTASGATV